MKRLICMLVILLLNVPVSAAEGAMTDAGRPLRNQLADNPSPYLALHGHDPVAWQEWGPDVLERARREGKLIFLSIGYYACHWCHVMQRESYSDAEVARVLNRHYIPVKIDRELEEALDARMIDFAERSRGRAGWPLNVFLTPQGYPLYAELYVPRDHFLSLITKLQDLWGSDPDSLIEMVKQEASANEPLPVHHWHRDEIESLQRQLRALALANADRVQGGFGNTQKFPSTPQLDYLLHDLQRGDDGELRDFLLTTLDHMASQGLYDHIGGGFFRYTTDPDWQTPHFEKMLYGNAQLAAIYLRATKLLSRPVYRNVALDTLAFMQREMRSPSGAFVASLSAVDNHNVEGGYYLWTEDQLNALLDENELAAVRKAWLGSSAVDFDAGHLLYWADGMAAMRNQDPSVRALLDRARGKLLTARRKQRVQPVDDKLLAGWNGLALQAIAVAASQTDRDELRQSARSVRDYLLDVLWSDGELKRAVGDDGQAIGSSTLADYAYVAEGLWRYYQLDGNRHDRDAAVAMVRAAWEKFSDAAGWRHGAGGLLPAAKPQAIVMDGALPSPSARLLSLSCEIIEETGDGDLHRQVRMAGGWGKEDLDDSPFWYASQVQALSGPCLSIMTAEEK